MKRASNNVKKVTKAAPVVIETVEAVETKKGKKAVVLTPEQIARVAEFAESTNTSVKIRILTSEGWSRSQIAKGLGILYQHVRNVQITPLKRTTDK